MIGCWGASNPVCPNGAVCPGLADPLHRQQMRHQCPQGKRCTAQYNTTHLREWAHDILAGPVGFSAVAAAPAYPYYQAQPPPQQPCVGYPVQQQQQWGAYQDVPGQVTAPYYPQQHMQQPVVGRVVSDQPPPAKAAS